LRGLLEKVHASSAENVMFVKRLGVSLAVPWNASPEFMTTGINGSWRMRVEFIGPRLEVRRSLLYQEDEVQGTDEAEPQDEVRLDFPKLLSGVGRDHRGAIFGPIDRLLCDSFEVEVPIRVYGAVIETGETADVEGLIV